MEDGQHVNFLVVPTYHVDDPIIAIQNFTDRFIADLRDDAPHLRKLLKRTDFLDYLLFENLREVRRTDTLVVFDDGIKFVLGLLSETDTGHADLLLVLLRATTLQPRFHLVERHRLSFRDLLQANFDLVQENETLDGVLDGSVLRQFLNSADNLCFCGRLRHKWLHPQVGSASQNVRPRAVAGSQTVSVPYNGKVHLRRR